MLTQLFLRLAFAGSEWVLWFLMMLSFVSIALIVERALYFNRTWVDGESLGVQLAERLKAGDLRGAWQLVSDARAIECTVVESGLVSMRYGSQACGEAMLSTKARERGRVDARLNILGTIGANAPFIGLLGTVLGIIKAAHDLTGSAGGGQANPNAVMAGVFEALVATAVGLFVAIPAVVAFNYFQRRVRERMAQVDSLAHLVLSFSSAERRAARTNPQPEQVH